MLTNTLSINTENVQVTGAFAQIKDEIESIIETIFQPEEYTTNANVTEVEEQLDQMKSTPKAQIFKILLKVVK